jgi:DNA-binding NtrC family response regulator
MMTDIKIRILIIDDEERLLRVLRMGLKPLGYDVVTATSAQEGLNLIFKCPLDIILTDIALNAMSGVDLVFELERLNIGLPVIVMTAFAEVDLAVKSLKHGAVDFIRKPFSIEEIDVVLRDCLLKNCEPDKRSAPVTTLNEGMARAEKDLILKALEHTGHVKAKAAKVLGISERTLWYKIKKYNIG